MPAAFHDLPPDYFPITFELWGPRADRRGPATWSCTVAGPGAVEIPGLGRGTWTRITWGDGSVTVKPPPNAEPGEEF